MISSLLSAAPAQAEDPPPRPLAPIGQGLTIAAGAQVGTGVLLAALSPQSGEDRCGLTGCYTRPSVPMRVAGHALLAGGIGHAVIGIPTWIAGARTDDDPRAPQRARYLGPSLLLASFGLSSVGAGATLLAERRSLGGSSSGLRDAATAAGTGLVITGSLLSLAAIPVGIVRRFPAPPEPPPRADADPEGSEKVRSPGLIIAGSVVTAVGAAVIAGGLIRAGQKFGGPGGGEQSMGNGMIAGFLMGGGGLACLAGIPMIVVGALPRAPSRSARVSPFFGLGVVGLEGVY